MNLKRNYIVVCTKNRPLNVQYQLKSLMKSTSFPEWNLIVVDGSKNKQTYEIISHFKKKIKKDLVYLSTEQGKASALNLALCHLNKESVTPKNILFLDDDIELSLEDFDIGIQFLESHEIAGFSPLIVDVGEVCEIPTRKAGLSRQAKTDGKLTKSGRNRWVSNRIEPDLWHATEWLPGGACLYKWDKIRELRFEESLESVALGGYALGEDLLFSLQVSLNEALGCFKGIQVIHNSMESRNLNSKEFSIARGRLKAYLVKNFPTKVNEVNILSFEFASSARTLVWRRRQDSLVNLYCFLKSYYITKKQISLRNSGKRISILWS